MQETNFDEDAARENLMRRELAKVNEREQIRLKLLNKVIDVVQNELTNKNIEVWLIGSITRPFQFTKRSDVDIVVKNYQGDRFDFWTFLENKIGHEIEIIRYEECSFQNEIQLNGLKVL